MKKLRLLPAAVCATLALCSVPFIIAGCSEKQAETDFGEWVTVTAPTCEAAGLEMRTSLSDPDAIQSRAIPATGHDWNEWEVTTEPTCLTAGVETRTCNTCENSDMRAIPALGHNWGAWEIIAEADCENSGYQSRVCLRDGTHTEVSGIRATGHDFSEWVITRAPTCTVDGVETRYCRNCNNHTEVRAVAAYGHNWSEFVTTKPATCTEEGEQTSYCKNDASHTRTYTINARGHSFGDWVISMPATESEDGEEIRVCRRDASHTETRVLPAVGSEGLSYELNAAGTEYAVRGNYASLRGTVYIPATYKGLPVTAIRNNAFSHCEEIEKVVFLGNNLRTVGSFAFYGCEKLQSIEFPEGTMTISTYPFANCTSLKSVSFPSTVVSIGKTAGSNSRYINTFQNCPIIESITVAEGNPVYKAESGCLIEKATNTLVAGTVNAVIPQTITKIENRAFFNREIESINIPASVESIGSMAFSGCKKLVTVTFEDGAITQLGDRIFSGCTALESITLPENVTVIGSSTFSGCTALREVVLNEKLEKIGRDTFEGCTALEKCEIPASVTYIDPNAFRRADISKLTVADGNETYFIDGNCIIERATDTIIAGADNAAIPDYVTAIGSYAFYNRNIESIVIPEGVQSIGSYAFSGCASLRSITFEGVSGLQTIGSYAFNECTSLMGITLPVSIREIGSSAFYNCSAITSVTFRTLGPAIGGLIPVYATSDLESIGSYAFSGTGIKTFEIPAAVTKIGSGAFRSDKLTSLTVEEGNTAYKMESGCLIEIATGTVLLAFDDAVIPDGVKVIDGSAFSKFKGEKLEIPASVEKVGSYAFTNFTAEQTIVIKGFASREEADAAWGSNWISNYHSVKIVYEG